MNEILIFLGGVLSRIIPAALKNNDKATRRRVAHQVFEIYRLLNDCIMRGGYIVAFFRMQLAKLSGPDGDGKSRSSVGVYNIDAIAADQVRDLERILQTTTKLAAELQIMVDGPDYRRLVGLVMSKGQSLILLRNWIRTGSYPVSRDAESLWREIEAANLASRGNRELPASPEHFPSLDWLPLGGEMTLEEVRRTSLEETLDFLEEQLSELASTADAIRDGILANVSAQELLAKPKEFGSTGIAYMVYWPIPFSQPPGDAE